MSDLPFTTSDKFDTLPLADELAPDSDCWLFSVDTGGATYWVSALRPGDALNELDGWGDCECACGDIFTVRCLTLEEANAARYDPKCDGFVTRMAHEFNRDPSPRIIACSEY